MRINPYINALAASAYIGGIVLLIHFLQTIRHDTPDTLVDGVGFLSLFVFSAATMGCIFFYQPAMLLLEGKKHQAVSFFLKTLITFGAITALVFIVISMQ